MGKGRREAGRGRVRGRERGREKVGKGGRKQTCRYVMCFISLLYHFTGEIIRFK